MTWSKFDDAAPKSPKAVAAGNDAWALWAAAVMYCNRHNTDGYVTLAALAVDCLPKPLTTARAKALATKLCEARSRPDGKGLFELDRNDMYRVHDFLDWNPSKIEVESKRKKDRDRKRGTVDSERNPGGVPDGERADSETPRAPARALPSRPVPSRPEREEIPSPPATERKSGAGERCLDALTNAAPAYRADVLRIHEAWKRAFGRRGAKFLNPFDEDAIRIAKALETYGETDCLLVCRYAPEDDKVTGRTDEKGEKHESIRYLFENNDAFSRILRHAQKRESELTTETPTERIERLKKRTSGAA